MFSKISHTHSQLYSLGFQNITMLYGEITCGL